MTARAGRWLSETAVRLDAFTTVPRDVLGDLVANDGACMRTHPDGDPPLWLFEDGDDREIAARLCAGCSVRDPCLELELRLFADLTVGVWGALGEEDRRVLHRFRQMRRLGRATGRER
jgi:WhiB family transcriptional regulator, redox-sensing transcriptional regulator